MDVLDQQKPNFYELVMCDKLQEMIEQSSRFITRVVCDKYPLFTGLRYYTEEISSLFMGLVDAFSLFKTGGNFSENFYSLERTPLGHIGVVKYLLVKYLLPLLARHLPWSSYWVSLVDLAKGLHMGAYLYLSFKYFSPQHLVLKQTISRKSQPTQNNLAFLGVLFVLKGLEIFVNSRDRKKELGEVKMVPPPYRTSKVPKGYCGICKDKFVNPTALSVSGYVFCYMCIKAHVQTFAACPVTNFPAGLKNLRKLHAK